MHELHKTTEEPKFFIPNDLKDFSYEVSEGEHEAHLSTAVWIEDELGNKVPRLAFEITDMPSDEVIYIAAATYKSKPQQDRLGQMLKTWLGDQLPLFKNADGSINFQRLIDTKYPVILTIDFYEDGNHKTSFRNIKALNPAHKARKGQKAPEPVTALRGFGNNPEKKAA